MVISDVPRGDYIIRLELDVQLKPEGTVEKIVFLKFNSMGTIERELCIMNTDGSDEKKLFISDSRFLAWSPDGSKIAFVSNHVGWKSHIPGGDVYIINSDGTGLRELVDTHAIGPIPWSPSGDALIFNLYSYDGKETSGGLMVDAITGSIFLSIDESNGHIFSQDGKRLIYCRRATELLSTTTTSNPSFITIKNVYGPTSEIISMDLITGEEVSIKKFEDSVRLQALPVF